MPQTAVEPHPKKGKSVACAKQVWLRQVRCNEFPDWERNTERRLHIRINKGDFLYSKRASTIPLHTAILVRHEN